MGRGLHPVAGATGRLVVVITGNVVLQGDRRQEIGVSVTDRDVARQKHGARDEHPAPARAQRSHRPEATGRDRSLSSNRMPGGRSAVVGTGAMATNQHHEANH
jgi:hypothetical protein